VADQVKQDELAQAEALINELVDVHGYQSGDDQVAVKIDLLDQLLWRLRVKRRNLESGVDFDAFNQGQMLVDGGRVHFAAPDRVIDPGPGTVPVRLQTSLLMFLLVNHGKTYRVFDIIDLFIHKIWHDLSIEDFKRTQTGVIRCFTNTRFAANTLREYGLLKFTRREAYKTWVLSLPGFVVASKVYQQKSWRIPEHKKAFNFDLHRDIWDAWTEMKAYDLFTKQLSGICKPNTEIFNTFEGFLRKAYGLLGLYWETLRDHSLSQAERRK